MFTDALELKLKLIIDKKNFKIPGGNVKTLGLELHQYGFTCQLSFWVSSEEQKDTLYPLFIKPELIKVELQVLPHFNPKKLRLEAIELKGLVTNKKILAERTIENVNVKGNPVLYRHYRIEFADPARVLWHQHFPCDLLTDKCVKDILEAHKGKYITLAYDWKVLDDKYAINTVPLGTGENKASFYDFVLWYVNSLGGVWTYDCNKNVYTFSQSKKEDGKSTKMDKEDVEEFHVEFPETIRYTPNVLNAYSDDPKREVIEHDQAIDKVRRDYVGRFPIASDFINRKDLETRRFLNRQHEIQLTFRNFPCIPHRPGCMVELKGPGWSRQILAHGKVYRVRDVSITARSAKDEVTADYNMPFARYTIDMKSQLELKDEKWVSLPAFQSPVFPLYVEGKIKSEVGEEQEKTYQIYQDPDTSRDQYRVFIPLWDNQEIVVHFEPDYFSGHFYFPAYRMARVLVALHFHSARIEQFLDWKEGARLSLDTQGNHLLFGKTPKNRTSINHVYEEEKPVLNVKRTRDIDTQSIRFEEGRLILETKEEEE